MEAWARTVEQATQDSETRRLLDLTREVWEHVYTGVEHPASAAVATRRRSVETSRPFPLDAEERRLLKTEVDQRRRALLVQPVPYGSTKQVLLEGFSAFPDAI